MGKLVCIYESTVVVNSQEPQKRWRVENKRLYQCETCKKCIQSTSQDYCDCTPCRLCGMGKNENWDDHRDFSYSAVNYYPYYNPDWVLLGGPFVMAPQPAPKQNKNAHMYVPERRAVERAKK